MLRLKNTMGPALDFFYLEKVLVRGSFIETFFQVFKGDNDDGKIVEGFLKG